MSQEREKQSSYLIKTTTMKAGKVIIAYNMANALNKFQNYMEDQMVSIYWIKSCVLIDEDSE